MNPTRHLMAWTAIACLMACDDPKTPAKTPKTPETKVTKKAPKAQTPEAQTPPKAPSAPAGMQAVFDLVDNRHLAHVLDQGLVIDVGHGSALKYVQGRWKNPWYDTLKDGDTLYAHTRGPGAVLRVPLMDQTHASGVTGEDWVLQARMRPVGDQRCDVFLKPANGKESKIGSLSLKPDFQTYEVKLPKGLPLGREYTLRFHFSRSRAIDGGGKSAAALDYVRVGKKGAEPPRHAALFDPAQRAIDLPTGLAIAWYTQVAAGARLAGTLSAPASLHITADGVPSVEVKLPAGTVDVDLSKYAGKPVRLALRAKESAKLTGAAIVRPAPKAVTPRGEAPQVMLVWLIDTLRADHMSVYNEKTDVTTPNLDAFAKEAAVFERATVQGNSSLPSSASIFTSTYPSRHGVVTQSARLSKNDVLLGEAMQKAGYKAGMFSSNGYVSKNWGFTRGFSHDVNPIRQGGPSEAEHLWPKAKGWIEAELAKDPKAKLLVYLNTSDPHVPYDPPKDDLARYHSGGAVGKVSPRGTGQLLHDLAGGKVSLNASELAYMRALYKGEITYNDRWFGKMLEDLGALGVRDKSMVVVTSDHGEEFGEYGRFGHGISVNQELVDIPILIGYQPWTKSGVRVEHAIEAIDIYPTMLDAAGVREQADNVQGASLVEMMLGAKTHHPTPGVAYHNDFLRSVRVGDWKYHLYQGDKDPLFLLKYGPTKLKNYAKAPGLDGQDLRDSHPIGRRMMRDVAAFLVRDDKKWRKSIDGQFNNHTPARATNLDGAW